MACVNYPMAKARGLQLGYTPTAYGWLTAALRLMFTAAMVSAGPANPQDTQQKWSRVGRFALSMVPHSGQVREVFWGSTRTTGTPANRALYSINCRS